MDLEQLIENELYAQDFEVFEIGEEDGGIPSGVRCAS